MTIDIQRLRPLIEKAALAFSAACCGVVLYMSLFPKFYYLVWIADGCMLWGAVAVGLLCRSVILAATAHRGHRTTPSSRSSNTGFIMGMLVLVSLLVGFKVPLHASFLLARPGLEQALAEHRDDLTQVGLRHYDFGLYPIRKAYRGCHTVVWRR